VRLRVAGLTAHQALGFAVGGRAWAGHPVTAQLGTAASPPAGGQEAHARRPSWLLPSRRWTSVTPVVLDRFPRKGAVESEVIRSVLQAGLPEPVEVAVSLAPLLPGGVPMRSADLPDSLRARLFRHVSLVFDRPVAGPILLGAGRYLGVGVFVGG
jgi:CRISPR-associated protein Csb2